MKYLVLGFAVLVIAAYDDDKPAVGDVTTILRPEDY
jgi:hypothetical protein